MPGFVFIPVTADFPQIANLRSQGEIIEDLLDYTGGGDRTEARRRARRALTETIRAFNGMAWRFNRRTQDVTLLTITSEYDLNADIRNIWKVMMLDTNGQLAGSVEWIPYQDFLRYDGSTVSTVTVPNEYTVFNFHNEGKIYFLPRIGEGPFIYPKARVFYHKRIDTPGSDDDYIDAPEEVETAIVRQAAALLVARTRTFEEATRARADANAITLAAQREWRDWPDFRQRMG
ncbi:hypothetical protein KAR02_02485 [Candidatus Bipolaricaulota bacterium]|nr:hypothetical protein [Candidatus Bipolaricaulota bacterium]